MCSARVAELALQMSRARLGGRRAARRRHLARACSFEGGARLRCLAARRGAGGDTGRMVSTQAIRLGRRFRMRSGGGGGERVGGCGRLSHHSVVALALVGESRRLLAAGLCTELAQRRRLRRQLCTLAVKSETVLLLPPRDAPRRAPASTRCARALRPRRAAPRLLRRRRRRRLRRLGARRRSGQLILETAHRRLLAASSATWAEPARTAATAWTRRARAPRARPHAHRRRSSRRALRPRGPAAARASAASFRGASARAVSACACFRQLLLFDHAPAAASSPPAAAAAAAAAVADWPSAARAAASRRAPPPRRRELLREAANARALEAAADPPPPPARRRPPARRQPHAAERCGRRGDGAAATLVSTDADHEVPAPPALRRR